MPMVPQTYTLNGLVFTAGQILNMSNTEGMNLKSTVVCYAPSQITTNGVWQKQSPLDYSLPLFILQLMIIVSVTRGFVYILKPFRQPRIISEILGGVVLGPSCLGMIEPFAKYLFPLRSVMVLETMGNIGLLYHLFLSGVEMDLSMVTRTGQRAMLIAVVAFATPFIISLCGGIIINLSHHTENYDTTKSTAIAIFVSVSISVTAFPVITRLLADLKLLNTDVGRVSMSAAIINDMGSWILLAIAIILKTSHDQTQQNHVAVLYGCAFVLFVVFVIRPAIVWIVNRTPEGESFNDFYICLILTGVMICGFVTDAIGTHSVFGAFIFGLIIPNGPLGTALIEKLEDFVTALLLPLFFAVSGLRTSIKHIVNQKFQSTYTLFLVLLMGSAAKIGSTYLTALLYDMHHYEALSMGLLMNTKGLVQMVALNASVDLKAVDVPSFTMVVFYSVLVTSITAPAIMAIYKPGRRFIPYKRRTIQNSKGETELRILACVHTPRNVPTIINLLEASCPTKKSPICIYALHLVELTGRASAMLIVHNARKSGGPAINRTQAQSDHIIHAFENYVQHTGNVTVQPLTAISPYSTMHEDICNIAEDKRVTLIIVPFHKQQTVDGGMEASNPAIRSVNQNVLINAPCSIGILIDRGLGGAANVSTDQISRRIAVLFIGGPDDREALAYGWRMAEQPGVNLSVMRFIYGEYTVEPNVEKPSGNRMLTVITETERQKQLDDAYISNFRQKTAHDESIVLKEIVANNGEETVTAVRSIEANYDLYIVGRGESMTSPLTVGLTDWSECPELGAIGDLLASSDFSSTVSVLVVQQHDGKGLHGDEMGTPDSAGEQVNRKSYDNPGQMRGNHGHNMSISFENDPRSRWDSQ